MSRLTRLGLTTKLPKLKYNDEGLGGREGGRGRGRGGRRLISENHEQLVIRVYSNQKVIKSPVSEVLLACWLLVTSN